MGYNFCKEKIVRARKDHKCEWCCEEITAGTETTYVCGLFDGDFYSYYLHPECCTAIKRDPDLDWDDGMPGERQGRGMTQRETEAARESEVA